MRAVLASSLLCIAACDLSPLPVDGGSPADAASAPTIDGATGSVDAGSTLPGDAASAVDASPSSDGGSDDAATMLDATASSEDAQVGAPSDAALDAATDTEAGSAATFAVGVNTHNYPKPMAYGYLSSDGSDRMGEALRLLGVHYARGAIIGDVAFLTRLHEFGVTHALLGLDAKAYGKPFDPAKLQAALALSVAEARRIGLEVMVEGLNEWDLFRARAYNDGVEPAGVSEAEFIRVTQEALYVQAHALGIAVLGPSVGHPYDQASLDFFPDVSAYVDIVNMHFYFGQSPDTLPVSQYVTNHQAFQGAGKPVWVTETGVSAYGGVSEAQQADIIVRGYTRFMESGQIAVAFNYELLDTQLPGFQNGTFVPDSGEYHFGLFRYDGQVKTAGLALADFIALH